MLLFFGLCVCVCVCVCVGRKSLRGRGGGVAGGEPKGGVARPLCGR